MMGKKTTFVCEACGYEAYKWMGRCPRCEGWDTIREVTLGKGESRHGGGSAPVVLYDEEVSEERVATGMGEVDRVLGGGLTRGSSILLGGDPGIGKTTLCFEIISRLTEQGKETLYISGEESSRQLFGRKKRLGLTGNFPILVTNDLHDIVDTISKNAYDFIVIDSIQSVYNTSIPMLPGSTGQIRDVSTRLIRELKGRETSHIFIGHVTKEGVIAGPKILEHMVDTVLYFEGDKMLPYRMVRAIKNRFGSVDEVGIFLMSKDGLASVDNPSEFFLSPESDFGSGCALFPYVTGSRPILIEVQAITPETNFANPRRLSVGYDLNRLFILVAVLEKVTGIRFYNRDIYVNVTGGMKVSETGVDLAVAAALISASKDVPTGRKTAFFGEIGLTGEVRKVVSMDMRLKECRRTGVDRLFCPKGIEAQQDMEMIPLRNLKELREHLA